MTTDTKRTTETEPDSSTASGQPKELWDEARDRGGEIGRQAKNEARRVADEVKQRVVSEADDQASRAAEALRSWSGQLGSMADASSEQGRLTELARDGADRIERFADQLGSQGLEGVVDDLQQFARRRPGMFLAASMGVGFAIGRLFRATDMEDVKRAARGDTDDESETPAGPRPMATAAGSPTAEVDLTEAADRP